MCRTPLPVFCPKCGELLCACVCVCGGVWGPCVQEWDDELDADESDAGSQFSEEIRE